MGGNGGMTGSTDGGGDGPASPPGEYYVAAHGDDTNPGTEALPLER